ncbi:MAG TPA: dihydrofolate reductase family protein [Gemmatimonadaceae bacterium]|nr:dihydrofolate reductase family protein [Gemmatimonadaceae bacterium]
MPRRLVVTDYISLDGVIEDPVGMEGSGLGNWTGPFSRGPEGDRVKYEELMASDVLLLGRRTYDGFAAVWPTVQDEAGFAARINAMPKYVASRTLTAATWTNSTVISDDLVGKVRGLKAQDGGDLLVYGSASVVHTLLPHGLVDEFRLMVYPTILGRGIRLFPDGVRTTLRLTESTQLGSGIVLLRYDTA